MDQPNNLSAIISEVSLTDVLAQPTQARPEAVPPEAPVMDRPQDFAPASEVHTPEIEPTEPEEPYDAEKEAANLVTMISSGNILIMTPIAHFKMTKTAGGKAGLDRMKTAIAKRAAGKQLTEKEEAACVAFERYKADYALLNGDIMYSPKQIEMLKTAAIPWCESSRFKVNPAMGFWGVLLGVQAQKIAKIITA